MKFIRNHSLRTQLFLAICLQIACSYSTSIWCSCCSPNEYCDGIDEKHLTEQLSIDSTAHPENERHCQCKQCGIPNTKDTVLSNAQTDGFKEKHILAFKDGISEINVTLINKLCTHTSNKYPPTSRPIFLLKSSFLL